METIVGIFPTRQTALEATQELRSIGIAEEQLTLMEPQSSLAETPSIDPPRPEAPGSCGANRENVQGAILGFAGGLLGSTILVLALPGIGPIAAVGALGLSGAVGSLAGGVFGQVAHHEATTTELTPQEFLTYEEALRENKYLLIVQHNGESNKQSISWLLARHGAEDFDRSWEQWWKKIRVREMEVYAGSPEEFARIERKYREGFESALTEYGRQSTSSDTGAPIKAQNNAIQDETFQLGYTRGRLYYETMLRQYTKKEEQSTNS